MILLCTASDDYVEKYKPCIDSQEKYAKKLGYTYNLICGSQESRNWKRAKIDELEKLLTNQDQDVCLIDGDCLIKNTCPSFETFLNDNSIYYANGKSGRLNSGFLYFKNNDYSLNFVKELKKKLELAIPEGKGYFVTTEGENGHIIWLQNEWTKKDLDIFQEIPKLWNCTSPKLKDEAYILHFTNDLRKEIYKYNASLRSS